MVTVRTYFFHNWMTLVLNRHGISTAQLKLLYRDINISNRTQKATYPGVLEVAKHLAIPAIQRSIRDTKKFGSTLHVNLFVLYSLKDASDGWLFPKLLSSSESQVIVQFKDGEALEKIRCR